MTRLTDTDTRAGHVIGAILDAIDAAGSGTTLAADLNAAVTRMNNITDSRQAGQAMADVLDAYEALRTWAAGIDLACHGLDHHMLRSAAAAHEAAA